MKLNVPIKNRFKNNLNYERTVSRAGYKNFPWTRDAYGLCVKIGLFLIFEEKVGNSFVHYCGFREQGLTENSVRDVIKTNWPEFPGYYKDYTGHKMTWKAPYDRVHKFFYTHSGVRGSGKGGISDEHPFRHPEWNFIIERMSELLHRRVGKLDEASRAIAAEFKALKAPKGFDL